MAISNFIRKKTGLGLFAAECKNTKDFIGWVALRPFYKDEIEVGYRMPQKNWGKGYATEMSKAMVEYGFNQIKLQEIAAIVNPANKASKNVLSKSGLKYIGNMDYTFNIKENEYVLHVEYWNLKNT